MGILTYQACWGQQRQRRGPCPGEPLKENRTSSQIQWGGLAAISLTGIRVQSGGNTCQQHNPRALHVAPYAPARRLHTVHSTPASFPVSLGSPLVHQGVQEGFPDCCGLG